MKHNLCYRDTVKSNLIFMNKRHRTKNNLCYAEIIYPIIDIVLLSNILWMLWKIDFWPAISAYFQIITWALLTEYHFQIVCMLTLLHGGKVQNVSKVFESLRTWIHICEAECKANHRNRKWTEQHIRQNYNKQRVTAVILLLLWLYLYNCAVIKALPQHLGQCWDWKRLHVCELNLKKKKTTTTFVLTVSLGPQWYQLVLCKECWHFYFV